MKKIIIGIICVVLIITGIVVYMVNSNKGEEVAQT